MASWPGTPCRARGEAGLVVLRLAADLAVPAQVEQLSERAQATIQRYAGAVGALAGAHAGLCSVTGILPWAHPTSQEYEELARVTPCMHPRDSWSPFVSLSVCSATMQGTRRPQLMWAEPLQLPVQRMEDSAMTTAFKQLGLCQVAYSPALLNASP